MPLFKGKDIQERRETSCGCLIKWYPIGEANDLLDFSAVRRTLDMDTDGKWVMQFHSHPDFEEYWFVLKGKGQFFVGDEVYDVEPGDLVITPRGVPHKAKGDITFLCITAKHNVYGQTLGMKIQYLAHAEVYRDNPGDAVEVGKYLEFDVRTRY